MPDLAGQPVTRQLDLYEPTGDTATRRPVYAFTHPGWGSGAGVPKPSPEAELATRRGFVGVSIGFRLIMRPGSYCMPEGWDQACVDAYLDAIHDAQAAVRWLRANAAQYRLDPDRIAFAGQSAGGVIASGVGVWSEAPGASGTPGPSSRVQAFVTVSGCLPDHWFADPGDSPGVLFSGTDGEEPWTRLSPEMATALRAAGVDAEYHRLPGGHFPAWQNVDPLALPFVYRHLDLAHAEH